MVFEYLILIVLALAMFAGLGYWIFEGSELDIARKKRWREKLPWTKK
jgi:hypothetical protein